ncbi:DUF488 domain-containing protein [Desulfotruncus alcoholivorax]|uniref:DUF488 domain-containing protein n=1 Tax=Desulfotruncus alcoholivorax TaxID=265477 RepID=UPI001EE55771|nr:DUF488 domain-containing protein [Desulfotruncus alcoholivorax]
MIIIYTIGFSKKNLRQFITRLKDAGVNKLIDVRLNNTSQLAGYAKKDDLEYILSLVGIDYEHHPELAPTEELMKKFKKKQITWQDYEEEYNNILLQRDPLKSIDFEKQDSPVCLLCSEDKPEECHRRLLAEYYSNLLPNVKIGHL